MQRQDIRDSTMQPKKCCGIPVCKVKKMGKKKFTSFILFQLLFVIAGKPMEARQDILCQQIFFLMEVLVTSVTFYAAFHHFTFLKISDSFSYAEIGLTF